MINTKKKIEWLYLSVKTLLDTLSVKTFLIKFCLSRDLSYLKDEPYEDLGLEH